MSLVERLAPYEVSQPEPETFETTWCLVHMASGSSLMTSCYYADFLSDDYVCQLVPAQVLC